MSDETQKTLVGGQEANDNAGGESAGGTDGSSDWRSVLSDEYRGDKRLSDYKTADDFVKSHFSAQEMIGKKTSIPDETASPEEWNKFYKEKWGVPEKPSEYGIEVSGINPDGLEAILTGAQKAGLNKKQAETMANHLAELRASEIQSYETQHNDSYNRLVEKYGGEEKANEVLASVDNYAKRVFGEDSPMFNYLSNTEVIKANGEKVVLGNDTQMVEMLLQMFEKTVDDGKNLQNEGAASGADLHDELRLVRKKMIEYTGSEWDSEYTELKKKSDELHKKVYANNQ